MTKEKRILVVEDDDAIRALLFTVLRRRGFKVDTAPNRAHGLERFNHCGYSLSFDPGRRDAERELSYRGERRRRLRHRWIKTIPEFSSSKTRTFSA